MQMKRCFLSKHFIKFQNDFQKVKFQQTPTFSEQNAGTLFIQESSKLRQDVEFSRVRANLVPDHLALASYYRSCLLRDFVSRPFTFLLFHFSRLPGQRENFFCGNPDE